jgi:hypothetical protein
MHGTYEQRHLGHAVSHGCVRLSVKNAATLWGLVKREKIANTTVVLNGAIPGAGPSAVARDQQMPLNVYDPQIGPPPPQYERRYDDGAPPLPSPFFFGR